VTTVDPGAEPTAAPEAAVAAAATDHSASTASAPRVRTRRLGPDELAELEEERKFLLTSLTDLEREHDAGDLDDADYHALADGYTKRAAEVLRAIDAGRAELPPKKPRRWGRLVAGTAAVIALAAGAGILVAQASGQRLPGDTVSGDIAESANTLLAEARALQNTDPLAALDRYEQALELQPDNAEALTYLGWLRVRVGAEADGRGLATGAELVAKGEASLDRAIEVAPSYADPYCFKAITRFRFYGDAAGARPAVDACLASNPPQVVLGLVANLQAEIDAALGGAPTTVAPTTTP
jgi:tetratricopeptide (TPR) repeat protein